jgi:hypothetical protein
MKLKLKNGAILDCDTSGNFKLLNQTADFVLPDGIYFTKDNRKVWIEDNKIINILELVSFIVRILLKLFGKI